MADVTVVRGGTIVDGTGAPGVAGDVAIADGKIVGDRHGPVGRPLDRRHRLRRRARVHRHPHPLRRPGVLGPGADAVVLPRRHHRRRRQLRLLDRPDDARPTAMLIARTLEKVEDMDVESLAAGIPWDFETFPEYLASVGQHGTVAQLRRLHRPHAAAHLRDGRRGVEPHGDARRGRPRWPASSREAMDAGAAGFATSFAITHLGADGKPIPSRWSRPRRARGAVPGRRPTAAAASSGSTASTTSCTSTRSTTCSASSASRSRGPRC